MATTATRDDRLIRVDGPPLGYVPGFDGVRAIVVLIVVLYHAEVTSFMKGTPITVDWFFVASGFLITTLLLDERKKTGDTNLRGFYTRRVLRLFPAMYAMIGVFVVLMLLVQAVAGPDASKLSNWWVDALAAGLYSYNIVASAVPKVLTGAIGHTWTLSGEEQFYFVWPLVMLVVLRAASRRADRRLIIGGLAFVALFIFLRMRFQYVCDYTGGGPKTCSDYDHPSWQGFAYRYASTRPDMIVYGCLTAFAARAIPRPVPDRIRRTLAVVAPLCWVLFFVFLFKGGSDPTWGLFGGPVYQVALLGLGPIMLDLYFRRESFYARAFAWKPLRWTGQRAYGIYLWHVIPLLLLISVIESSYGMKKIAVGLVGAALGVGLGLLSFKYIERPFLSMKDRKFGARAGMESAATTTTEPGAGDEPEVVIGTPEPPDRTPALSASVEPAGEPG